MLDKLKETQLLSAESFDLSGIYLLRMRPKEELGKGTFLFLHGFPSWTTKNYDIAEKLCILGYTVYIPHYRGLGLSSGIFSFEKSLQDIHEIINYVKNEESSKSFSILGHSWGGFLAVNLIGQITDRLILLAPLIEVPTGDTLNSLVKGLFLEAPEDCRGYSPHSGSNGIKLGQNHRNTGDRWAT